MFVFVTMMAKQLRPVQDIRLAVGDKEEPKDTSGIPEFLNFSLQGFAASEQVVVVQQCPIKPALHLAGIQGVQTHCLLGSIYATHVHARLQSLHADTQICL